MKSYDLQIFADYFQFYLKDEAADANFGDAWDEVATARMFAAASGMVGFGTARNMEVPVTLEFLDAEPANNLADFDHVVEGTLVVTTGPLVVAGCTDFFPDADRFPLEPGIYRVRLSSSGLDSLSEDGLDGNDHYLVQLWLASAVKPTVLKQRPG
ncbi:hypothetical protein [uncultured Variovorax sp.]|uniref:hypothetical protein n=1 Tax=uncultured Variovorax sp. TaxID=114708 RepID=UPI0026013FB5|nr:hypothetical protein [uncultured Variovorax sp.]